MKGIKFLLLFVVLAIGHPVARAALSKTYPTSAVTTVRIDTYIDGFRTIFNSSWTIQFSTWIPMGSTWTFFNPDGFVNGRVYELIGSTWTVKNSSWTIESYTQKVLDQTKLKLINEIMDSDIEQYMVWPDTTTYPTANEWKGWCLKIINGNKVPIACPQ